MISIILYKTDQRYTGFCCSGHAGYAEEGEDIICAAVSALTINAVNSIEELTDDAMTVDQKEEGGYLKLVLSDDHSPETELLMNSLVLGLKTIEDSYGSEYVQITVHRHSNQ